MSKYVEVMVDVPVDQVDRPFTYKVPERLESQIKVGKKVVVPFGRQRVAGYIIGELEADEEDFKFAIKPINKVLTEFTFFDEELLELAKWMSEYYQSYLISSLKAIVPSGQTKIKTKQVVKLAQSVAESEKLLEQISDRAYKQQEVFSFLIDNPNCNLSNTELADRLETTSGLIRTLINKGYLQYIEKEVKRNPHSHHNFKATQPLAPTSEQQVAIEEISAALEQQESSTILLKGVTGSGKTEVYLQVIAKALEAGKDTIVLVPEISLTPQTIARFKGRFGDQVAVLHSQLSAGERFDEWRRIKFADVKIVVGARSAVFAPFNNLGLIIIDEEHETSYKQEDHPKYHAREVAVKRAELAGAVTVLGTATPSLEAYHRTETGEYKLVELKKRIDDRPLPKVELIDMREELKAGNKTMFSQLLQKEIIDRLEKGEQTMIFLNRRGFSTFVQCRECGHVMKCNDCDVSLTYHATPNILQCHYCDHQEQVPNICPNCESIYIKYFGVGTQKVEEGLKEFFPEAKVARMDVDTTRRKGEYERILSAFKAGKIDILVGTQMIAKGHDFSNVTLVGVITADTALNLPDFRAGERTFQLLTQVAGRTGRGDKPGEVIIQSYTPEHYSIQFSKMHDYNGFYNFEIETRKFASYPPFTHIISIVVSDEREDKVIEVSNLLSDIIREKLHKLDEEGIMLLGPVQAPLSKVRGQHRWQLLLKGGDLDTMRSINQESLMKLNELSTLKTIKVSVDVDPLGML
ncbi:replication restart DNA helicase PriA [Orenia metallireducens]|uniref:Replication restart protein PriA n=1 Tax=Orenia metallireducens TaxID=1413210 RepID=A0A285FHU6_9FIRM|nr:primosomal protein N' [Orenia metallireducens]PRX33537.1 replication restart DNA helicase PriA [Orenia metallireducens]SNY10404.1 replication restart DNA helicase PriA [Orenia metallireducens]